MARSRPLRHAAEYFAARLALCVLQAISLETGARLAAVLAWLVHDVLRVRRSVIDENLAGAFPDLDPRRRRDLGRAMWRHLLTMVCELAHLSQKLHEASWRRYIRLPNKAEMVRALLSGRPAVMVSGHFGNFELASYMIGVLGFSSAAVARTLDNPHLDRFVRELREKRRLRLLPKEGSAGDVAAVLAGGGILGLLGDQHAGPKGCWVEFLGRPASCHKAVALAALTAGAPLLVCGARRRGKPLAFEINLVGLADPQQLPPARANVKFLTVWYNAMLERLIRSRPDQYWWLHRRWREPPAKRAAAPSVPPDGPADRQAA